MRVDPYDVAENAFGAVVAILMLIALYAGGSDASKIDTLKGRVANDYATAAAPADERMIP
jgi:hypothetical protein